MIRATLIDDKDVENLESLCIYSYRLLPRDEFTKKLETMPPLLRDRAIQYHRNKQYEHFIEYMITLYVGDDDNMRMELDIGEDIVRLGFDFSFGRSYLLSYGEQAEDNELLSTLQGYNIPHDMFMDVFVHLIRMLKQEHDGSDLVIDLNKVNEENRYGVYKAINGLGDVYDFYTKVLTQYHRDAITMWITNVVGI